MRFPSKLSLNRNGSSLKKQYKNKTKQTKTKTKTKNICDEISLFLKESYVKIKKIRWCCKQDLKRIPISGSATKNYYAYTFVFNLISIIKAEVWAFSYYFVLQYETRLLMYILHQFYAILRCPYAMSRLQNYVVVSYGQAFRIASTVDNAPVRKVVFKYGRLDTVGRSEIIPRLVGTFSRTPYRSVPTGKAVFLLFDATWPLDLDFWLENTWQQPMQFITEFGEKVSKCLECVWRYRFYRFTCSQ